MTTTAGSVTTTVVVSAESAVERTDSTSAGPPTTTPFDCIVVAMTMWSKGVVDVTWDRRWPVSISGEE